MTTNDAWNDASGAGARACGAAVAAARLSMTGFTTVTTTNDVRSGARTLQSGTHCGGTGS